MHRQKIGYFLLTILIAAAFIAASMFCVRKLIEEKEASLLRGSGTIEQTGPQSAGWENADGEKTTLSVEEMQKVITNWNMRSGLYVHDPVEGQITMNEAVRAVDAWLPKMGLLDGILSGNSTIRSSLNMAKIKGEKFSLLSPVYSFWKVEVNGDELAGIFYVNAVTGQIWEASITLFAQGESFSESQLLESFIHLAGLEVKKNQSYYAEAASEGEAAAESGAAEAEAADKSSATYEEDMYWEKKLEIENSSMTAVISGMRYLTEDDSKTLYDESGTEVISGVPYMSVNFNIYAG